MNPQPKIKPARSPKYLYWIRRQPCCLTGRVGENEAHHEQRKGHGGKSTTACDSRAVPLYWKLHNKMETPGNSRASVWAEYKVDPEQVIKEMRSKWLKEGNAKFWEDV
jgi:hypothetical protein